MIRPLQHSDWEAWKPLWDGYLDFYRAELDAETTKKSFERLCDGTDRMHGLLALDGAGAAVGLAHLVLHPATWTAGSYCYLEDLFVAPDARGGEVASELILAVYEHADEAGATRVYWHTQEFNGPARSLYDKLGRRTSFVVYER
jgi:GNAT superfamily N-acetyltransferase